MAQDKVGKSTGEKTKAGRPVFLTPKGERVSEKSITVPIGDKWINVPSIHDGIRYSEDEVVNMLKKGKIKATSTHDSVEEAVSAAKERSNGLLPPKKFADGGEVTATEEKGYMGYKVREKLYPSEDTYFKSNPNVAGMASESGHIILNPYSSKDINKDAVVKNEAYRLYMRDEKINPSFKVTEDQKKFFKGSSYEKDEKALKQTIAARILSGDPSVNPTREQLEWVKTNQPTDTKTPALEKKDYFSKKADEIDFKMTELSPEEKSSMVSFLKESKWLSQIQDSIKEESGKEIPKEMLLKEIMSNDDYDYGGAYKDLGEDMFATDPASGTQHGYSKSPKTGKWYKSPKHETTWKQMFWEEEGYSPDTAKESPHPSLTRKQASDTITQKFAEGGEVMANEDEVPPGALPEEKADDIPAMLSEGEFVFPAEVVRYFGLEKLMQMRQQAKMGLQMMNDMGQMGNGDEATMPDDLPFGEDDLELSAFEAEGDEPLNFNVGGVVPLVNSGIAGYVPSQFPTAQPDKQTGQGIYKFTPSVFRSVGTGAGVLQPYETPQFLSPQAGGYTPLPIQQPTVQQPNYTYQQLMGGAGVPEMRTYRNAAGNEIKIQFINGVAQSEIPVGYTVVGSETQESVQSTSTAQQQPITTLGQSLVDGGGGDSADPSAPTASGVADVSLSDVTGAITGAPAAVGTAVSNALSNAQNNITQAVDNVVSVVSNPAQAVDNVVNSVSLSLSNAAATANTAFSNITGISASNVAPQALSTIGSIALGPLGNIIGAAIGAAIGVGPATAAATASHGAAASVGISGLSAFAHAISFGMFGQSFSEQMSEVGRIASTEPDGGVGTVSDEDDNAMSSFGSITGSPVGPAGLTQSEISQAIADAQAKSNTSSTGDPDGDDDGTEGGDSPDTSAGADPAGTDPDTDDDSGSSGGSGGGGGGGDGDGSGGDGSSGGCWVAGTKVIMGDFSTKNIEDLAIGDLVATFPEDDRRWNTKLEPKAITELTVLPEDIWWLNDTGVSKEEWVIRSNGEPARVRWLSIGDELLTADNKSVTITRVEPKGTVEPVFNFMTADNYSYTADGFRTVRGMAVRGANMMPPTPGNTMRECYKHVFNKELD